jgi:DNA (cytosine-5)-methyltransferase 1
MKDLKITNMTSRISADNFANLMGVSKATLQKWEKNGSFIPKIDSGGKKYFLLKDLMSVPQVRSMVNTKWDDELKTVPLREYKSIELFAGAGGLAIGMEKAGFKHVMLNELEKEACDTLRQNRPEWNVIEGDVSKIDFTQWKGQVDFISGGFPCQAFSYAGKQGGFNDTRGTMFFQLARAVKEIQPKVFMGENVKGLTAHDGGRTLKVIKDAICDLGYKLIEPRVLRAINYMVPQKRERLILIAIRNDYADKIHFEWPQPYHRIMTLRDAFFSGELYSEDVPESPFQKYPPKKQRVMEMIPMGGYWKDLPIDIQKEYLGGSFYLEGGKTGMARRLSLDEPSLTLTCAPAQKQTERCHPTQTRPLTVREYARIQTFPDNWTFAGNLSSQYKQIGNAVPVNLAWAIGRSVIRLMNQIELIDKGDSIPTLISHKSNYYYEDKTEEEEKWVQLSLFERQGLYLSKSNKNLLVGTCRQGTKNWIKSHLMYNYPITEDERNQHPELLNVKSLIIVHRKTLLGYYQVKNVKIVNRSFLKENEYPIKSSRHTSCSEYLLYTLIENKNPVPDIKKEDCSLIIGAGVS